MNDFGKFYRNILIITGVVLTLMNCHGSFAMSILGDLVRRNVSLGVSLVSCGKKAAAHSFLASMRTKYIV